MKRSTKKYQTKESGNKHEPGKIKQVSIVKRPCMGTTEDQMKELEFCIKNGPPKINHNPYLYDIGSCNEAVKIEKCRSSEISYGDKTVFRKARATGMSQEKIDWSKVSNDPIRNNKPKTN